MHNVICRMKPYIQPFERRLALDELKTLAANNPKALGGKPESAIEFSVASALGPNLLAQQLVYWEHVSAGTRSFPTVQSLREATVNVVRNGIGLNEIAERLPFKGEAPLPNRRCLRYGTHGIHEYRGKFFPQLVRALLNASGVPQGGIVADPMCGSGTTVAEAFISGRVGLGLDMNPLSVLMTRTKCALLKVPPRDLIAAYETTRKDVLSSRPAPMAYLTLLPARDQEYLFRWFSKDALAELDLIACSISTITNGAIRDFMRLALSNVLRRVSWQKDDDLRVRMEVRADTDIDPTREFLEELGRSVRLVLAFLFQNRAPRGGKFDVREGDARHAMKAWPAYAGKVDAVVTSPPYATALPYLDTDRLSLIFLGLLSRPAHRARDREMIGNREISRGERLAYENDLVVSRERLPRPVVKLISKIADLNGAEAGFRRQNMPALLTKYFLDMRLVLESTWRLLRRGGRAYVVVGDNHTIAGGQHVDINTSRLLAETAKDVGFKLAGEVQMEMLVSRDIFRRNAVGSEVILALEKVAAR